MGRRRNALTLPALGAGFVAALIAGCASAPTANRCVPFAAVHYCLQPAAISWTATQSVELMHAKGAERLIVQLEVNRGHIKMAGVTPFGRRVLWIEFIHPAVSSDMPGDAVLGAAHVLAGLQLAFWPIDRVRTGVQGKSARLVESADGTRRLTDGDALLFSASCDGERPHCRRAHLRYESLGHSLSIETLP
jgi:hypothetical protein